MEGIDFGQLGWVGLAEPGQLGGSGDQSNKWRRLMQKSGELDGPGKQKQKGLGPSCRNE